jgi:ribulose-phosphate 3-epimerase
MIRKITRLRRMIEQDGLKVDIQVDGGINSRTVFGAAEAGADVFVAGSAVFEAEDYREAIETLRRLASEGLAARTRPSMD